MIDGYVGPVPSFGPRMVCACRGIIGADVRPNCQEKPQSEAKLGLTERRIRQRA